MGRVGWAAAGTPQRPALPAAGSQVPAGQARSRPCTPRMAPQLPHTCSVPQPAAPAPQGCQFGERFLYRGEVVGLESGVPSPQDCCRRCTEANLKAGRRNCTVWNYCGQPGGCVWTSPQDADERVALDRGQCECRTRRRLASAGCTLLAAAWRPRRRRPYHDTARLAQRTCRARPAGPPTPPSLPCPLPRRLPQASCVSSRSAAPSPAYRPHCWPRAPMCCFLRAPR